MTETYDDVLRAVSFAIGSCGSVKPEKLAEAALQAIAEMGFVLFKPEGWHGTGNQEIIN